MSWIDNPYRTIIQMCELNLINKNQRIYQSLTDMSEMLGSSDVNNPMADRRISKAKEFIVNHFSNEMINDNKPAIQVHILRSMKQNLTE